MKLILRLSLALLSFTNPFSQTNFPGYSVWLSADATGDSALTWQWSKVGSGAIAGATTNFYIPTNAGTAGVAGSYYAVVSNSIGTATTLTAAVTFVSAPLPPAWALAVRSPYQGGFGVSNIVTDYYGGCAVDSLGEVYVSDQYIGDATVFAQGGDHEHPHLSGNLRRSRAGEIRSPTGLLSGTLV